MFLFEVLFITAGARFYEGMLTANSKGQRSRDAVPTPYIMLFAGTATCCKRAVCGNIRALPQYFTLASLRWWLSKTEVVISQPNLWPHHDDQPLHIIHFFNRKQRCQSAAERSVRAAWLSVDQSISTCRNLTLSTDLQNGWSGVHLQGWNRCVLDDNHRS